MLVFTKQDMYYNDYCWTNYLSNNPKVSGRLDTTRINISEGHEVLYLINKVVQQWDFTKLESCIKMERIIREKIPTNVVTQEEVATWTQIYWKSIQFEEMT